MLGDGDSSSLWVPLYSVPPTLGVYEEENLDCFRQVSRFYHIEAKEARPVAA